VLRTPAGRFPGGTERLGAAPIVTTPPLGSVGASTFADPYLVPNLPLRLTPIDIQVSALMASTSFWVHLTDLFDHP